MTSDAAEIKQSFPDSSDLTPNWKNWAFGYFLSFTFVVVLTIILVVFSPLKVQPITGSTMIKQANACDLNQNDCANLENVIELTLPHIDDSKISAPSRNWLYQLTYFSETPDNSMQAIYLPKFSETLQIKVNGTIIDDMPHFAFSQSRRWSRPEIYVLPQGVLAPGVNDIEIKLAAYKNLSSDIFPIYIGPAHVLKASFDRRYWVTQGLARVSIILLAITSIALAALWVLRRRDPRYFWLIICNIFGLIVSIGFAFDNLGISFESRMVLIVLSIEAFIASLLMFYAAYIQVQIPRLARAYWSFIVILALILVLTPEASRPIVIKAGSVMGFAFGFVTPALVWVYRGRATRSSFAIMFFAYCLTAVLIVHDATLVMLPGRFFHTAVTPFFPIMYLVTVLWLIGTQLMDSLNQSELLSRTLQSRVDEKTEELERSYKTLTETQRLQTLDQERQRIMMDLHDGIGGQLVNAIAYMENSQMRDATLTEALENALRDLSFMIDSLESDDSISTLLGMYRSRVEPLLESKGLRFNWKIGDEPVIPQQGPSNNLNLLRIIQEAVTNSIKHSGGDIITVKTDSRSVSISDNGSGFSADQRGRSGNIAGGVGSVSMRKRAKDIGAEIDIKSDDSGTDVTLTW
ncbi:MAG: ATP-binding protein [Hellea sp.]